MSREPLTLIPALDGLRALACVLVVASHIPKYMSEATTLFHTDIPLGELGVTIFFVLSGFLMSHLYLSKEPTTHQLVLYVIARFSRIAPAYWLAIISSYVIYQYVDSSFLFDVSNSNVLRHLLFIGSAGIFWSIPPEIQYYAYFMLIWFVWQKKRSVVWVLSLSLLSIALISTREFWPGILLPSKLHFFISGSLAGLFFNFLSKKMMLNPVKWMLLQVLAVIILVVYSMQLSGVAIADFYNHTLFFVSAALLVFVFSFGTKLSAVIFGNKMLRWVGKVSFSVYLFHGFVLYYSNILATRFELSGYLVDVSVFVISILFSGLFSIWIELPLCRWTKQRLQRRYQRFTEQRRQKVMLAGG